MNDLAGVRERAVVIAPQRGPDGRPYGGPAYRELVERHEGERCRVLSVAGDMLTVRPYAEGGCFEVCTRDVLGA